MKLLKVPTAADPSRRKPAGQRYSLTATSGMVLTATIAILTALQALGVISPEAGGSAIDAIGGLSEAIERFVTAMFGLFVVGARRAYAENGR